ncbi:hypothetical protein, partial [Undibacterium sp. Ji49W]|uniref:hypothetical protein n=1 Tax=Undibacterium sp. Ji49W TaxID=3413040 RepID=UPI003BF41082
GPGDDTSGLVVAGGADQALGATRDVAGAGAVQANCITAGLEQATLVVVLVTTTDLPITWTQRDTEMLLE